MGQDIAAPARSCLGAAVRQGTPKRQCGEVAIIAEGNRSLSGTGHRCRTGAVRTSENSTSETVRKGVRPTLRARIWLVYGG
jgi:hypothetical protein